MQEDSRAKVEARLKRIAGQVAGLQRMVAEDRYCVEVLTQVAAIRSALDAVGVEVLTNHVQHCVAKCACETSGAHANARAKSQEELVEELRVTLGRFLR